MVSFKKIILVIFVRVSYSSTNNLQPLNRIGLVRPNLLFLILTTPRNLELLLLQLLHLPFEVFPVLPIDLSVFKNCLLDDLGHLKLPLLEKLLYFI